MGQPPTPAKSPIPLIIKDLNWKIFPLLQGILLRNNLGAGCQMPQNAAK
jgi:hypothetical protein